MRLSRLVASEVQEKVVPEHQYRADPRRDLAGRLHGGHMSRARVYVGLDWGTRESFLHAIDDGGRRLGERRIADHVELLESLSTWAQGTAPAEIAIAVERRDIALVDALLEGGYAVFTINPKAVDRFRDRFSPAGAKDDRRDAKVLASSLRTDVAAFELVRPLSDDEIHVRTLVRLRSQIERHRRATANQLMAQVYRAYPALVGLCPGADRLWFLALLERIVTASPARIRRTVVEKLLKEHRVRRLTADDVIAVLRQPLAPVPAAIVEDVRFHVQIHVTQLRLLVKQRAEVEAKLSHALEAMQSRDDDALSDVELMLSMPGFGTLVVAALIATVNGAITDRDLPRTRALTGQAPVTKRSGRSCVVSRRLACQPAAREAMFHAASCAAMIDPRFKHLYDDMRRRGHSRGRALRGVGDSMLRVLMAVLKTRTPYEPARQPAAGCLSSNALPAPPTSWASSG
jgi:transposase